MNTTIEEKVFGAVPTKWSTTREICDRYPVFGNGKDEGNLPTITQTSGALRRLLKKGGVESRVLDGDTIWRRPSTLENIRSGSPPIFRNRL